MKSPACGDFHGCLEFFCLRSGTFARLPSWFIMKKASALLVVVLPIYMAFFNLSLVAAPHEKEWKAVEEAMGKGLPKSALEKLQPLLDASLAAGDFDTAARAIGRKITIQAEIEGNRPEEKITRIDAELATAPQAIRPVLLTLRAWWIYQYYQQNRHRFMERTTTAESPGDDFKAWDLPRILKEIRSSFDAALAESDALKRIPVSDYRFFLNASNLPESYRPTLYDVIAQEALAFFNVAELAGSLPEDGFVLQADSPILDDAQAFLAWKPETTDSASLDFRAVQIYQDLLRFHRDDKDRNAFLDIDLSRITWGLQTAAGENAQERGRAALERFAREHAGHELSALALHTLATTHQANDPLRAHTLALEGSKAFPESPFGKLCWNLAKSIETPSMTLQTERVWNSATPEFVLEYKNLREIHFRLVSQNWNANAQNRRYWNPEQADHQKIDTLLRATPERAWKIDLAATPDFKERALPLSTPGKIKPGFYFLIASAHPDFKEKDTPICVAAVWVTDLALVVRPNENRIEGFVLHAVTGEPVIAATIQEWHYTDNGKRRAGNVTATDRNGFFAFTPGERHRSSFLKASGQIDGINHSITSLQEVSPQWWSRPTEYPEHVFFFTDRTLYRPGQAIHYKGIALHAAKGSNEYKTLAGRKVSVLFEDANGKEIQTVEHVANVRGSFAGTFTAPRDRLMGLMKIRVPGTPYSSTSISVEEYKRPKFHTAIDAPTEPAQLNRQVAVRGQAATYADAPVDGAKVSWRVTRVVEWPLWCRFFFPPQNAAQEIAHGITTTAADGSYDIRFQARPDPLANAKNEPIFTFAVRADITDSAGETRSAERFVKVGFTTLQANLTAKEWQTPGQPVELSVGTTSLDGEPRAASGKVRIHPLIQPDQVQRPTLQSQQFRWAGFGKSDEKPDLSNPEFWEIGEKILELPFQTTEGQTKIVTPLPAGIYRAILETKDENGTPVSSRLTLRVIDPAAKRLPIKIPHLLTAENWTLAPGDKLRALWATGYERGGAYVEISQEGRVLQSFWTDPEATQQIIEYPISEELRGGFTLQITRVQENRAMLEARQIQVPWTQKKLTLKWEHFTSKLLPGAKETWTAVIQGPDAEVAAAEFVATLYDASLDQFKPWNWMSDFPVFRSENVRDPGQFQNDLRPLRQMKGGFQTKSKPVAIVRARFPIQLTQNSWIFTGGWRMGSRGGTSNGLLNRLVAPEGASLDDMSAPMPAAAPMQADELNKDKSATNKDTTPSSGPTIDPSQVAARKNLNETVFFFPQLTTDAAGVIRMEFTVPEALTTWRFLGFAHDTGLRSGLLEGKMVTAKDLMVQPNPPRFLREGDTVEFTVKITNRSEQTQTGKAQLHFNEAETGQPAETALGLTELSQDFAIPAKQSRTLSWRISVPDGLGFLTYKAVAATDTVSDGEEGWLPVLSRRVLVTESLPLPMRGPGTKTFTFQKLLDSKKSDTLQHRNLVVQMVSNPAWYAVMALPYLMEYPFECNEQIFNRFYANTLARHIAGSDPLIQQVFEQWRNTPALDSPLEKNQDLKSLLLEETPYYRDAKNESQARRNVGILFDEARLNSETERALQKLRTAQYPDGAWPWFPGGRGDDFITLYITSGFARLRHLGASVNIEPALLALNRLDAWIAEEYQDLKSTNKAWKNHVPTSIEAFYLYTRSFFLKDREIPAGSREAVDFYLAQAKKHWLQTGSRLTQGHLALALKRFGDQTTPTAIMASLKERSVSTEEMGMFWKDSSPSWWWNRAPIETQALLIEAFDEVTGDLTSVEECRVWLLKQKQTQNWKTTKSTADAIYALLLRGKDILQRSDLVEVSLGGTNITPTASNEAGTGAYEKRFALDAIQPAMGNITVVKKDEGVAWGGIHWQYLEDIAKITPREGTPLKLTKQVFIRRNTPQGPTLQALTGPVAPGDELIIRVELRVDRAMEYIHLKDQRGSGTEPVNVISGRRFQDGLSYYESTRDTASHFFIEHLPEGTYVFEYPVRVQLRGDYQTGIAEVQCMYAPEFNSHSASIRLQVQ